VGYNEKESGTHSSRLIPINGGKFMHLKNIIITFLAISIVMPVYSQVTCKSKPKKNSLWQAESLWVGAGLTVKDPSADIVVTFKRHVKTTFTGSVYFMVPGQQDSAIFLFHNIHEKYPKEPSKVNLGKFPRGTQIVFMFSIADTANCELRGKKAFTGQNRPGIDQYVSAIIKNENPGRRHALIGKIDATRVEVGFGPIFPSYEDIVFEVQGVEVVH
jgi:hypothetical protein